jgi:hypothetical protein
MPYSLFDYCLSSTKCKELCFCCAFPKNIIDIAILEGPPKQPPRTVEKVFSNLKGRLSLKQTRCSKDDNFNGKQCSYSSSPLSLTATLEK